TAVKGVTDALARIAELNPQLNAFIAVFEREAMEQARTLDEEQRLGRSRGPLHGRTISLKDLIDVRGFPTTAASRVRTGHVAHSDATLVTRLREAGAILIGKTNLHELALGTTSDVSAFGPVRNPRNLARSPGGSSGGSAAAVAAGMGWASIGSDTGGSIRIPASACGVVGLKPSFGEVPMVGVVPLSVSLDHVGPIAQTVSDAWAIHDVLTGATHSAASPQAVAGLRLGRLTGYFVEKLDEDVRARHDETLNRLKDAGASIVDVDLGRLPDIPQTYLNVALTEAFAYYAEALAQTPEKFSDSVRTRLQMGDGISRDDYVRSQGDRATMRSAVDAALSTCDALVLPTMPIPPQKVGAETVVINGAEEPLRPLTLRLTQLFNLTGHPAISLPCGETRDRLPSGFQMVGRYKHTSQLLQVALNCEAHVSPRAPSSSRRP
ncbi:MAG TPA: amidase, partial [Vicinamibacterales bacterium]|nr:amidase [Vicinamibacterales bacterium]